MAMVRILHIRLAINHGSVTIDGFAPNKYE